MKIFLSYAHDENSKLVRRIKEDLEKPENGGHECWFDESHIKAGDDWRSKISEGIRESEGMLSFISRHACREWTENGVRKRGVCLDELAIAIGTRGSIVKTILVENPTEPDKFSPPLTVSAIQFLDMHQWKDREKEGKEAFESWYSVKFSEIMRVINDPANQRFAGEIDLLRDKLLPLESTSRVGELMAKGFIGRDWLLDAIRDWLKNEPHQNIFCLTADPGFGKSAFAAWLVSGNYPEIIAAHFCQFGMESANPQRVVRSIAFQIASRDHDYRKFLINKLRSLESLGREKQQEKVKKLLEGMENSQMDATTIGELAAAILKSNPVSEFSGTELFTALIADFSGLMIDGGRGRRIVIIDALDEAGDELTEFLAHHRASLPSWLVLLVTSRPDESRIRNHLQMLNPYFMDVAEEQNQKDVEKWINNWLSGMTIDTDRKPFIADSLLEKSGGNFAYLEKFRSMAEQDSTLLAHPEAYPKGLDSLYLTFFKRQFPDNNLYRQWQAPLLQLLLALEGRLPVHFAREVLKISEEDWHIHVMSPLGSLFRLITQDTAEIIEPYHKSILDWLGGTNSDSYYVDKQIGRKLIAQTLQEKIFSVPNGMAKALELYKNCPRSLHRWGWSLCEAPQLVISSTSGPAEQPLALELLFKDLQIVSEVDRESVIAKSKALMQSTKPRSLADVVIRNRYTCRIDVLEPNGEGAWNIYKLSPSTRVNDYHLRALGLQAVCLQGAGYAVGDLSVVLINPDFVYNGQKEYAGLFKIENVTDEALESGETEILMLPDFENLLLSKEPDAEPGNQCHNLIDCSHLAYCTRGLPEYPVTLLPKFKDRRGRTAASLRKSGYMDLRDVPTGLIEDPFLEKIRRITVSGKAEVDPAARAILESLPFPRYFLDFETIQFEIPIWPGTRPYQQIPFQWSCHILDSDGGLQHIDFLDTSGEDPMRHFTESLISTIKNNGVILVYNKAFEANILRTLAERYCDLAPDLMAMIERMFDLLPITRQNYYHPQMMGSFSLKMVLPTIANDLDYSAIPEIQNGLSAQRGYLEAIAPQTGQARKEQISSALKTYCELDTLALLRLYRHLVEV